MTWNVISEVEGIDVTDLTECRDDHVYWMTLDEVRTVLQNGLTEEQLRRVADHDSDAAYWKRVYGATHWMPLPAPPKMEDKGNG